MGAALIFSLNNRILQIFPVILRGEKKELATLQFTKVSFKYEAFNGEKKDRTRPEGRFIFSRTAGYLKDLLNNNHISLERNLKGSL